MLTMAGLLSPLCVCICLPYLRGHRKRDDLIYGLFSISKHRLLDICGLADKQQLARSYEHIKIGRESYNSNYLHPRDESELL